MTNQSLTPENFFVEEELQVLLKALKDAKDLAIHRQRFNSHIRDWAIVNVFLYSGLRNFELTNLKIGDIYEDKLVVRRGKGNKVRVVLLTKEFQQVFSEFLKLKKKALNEPSEPTDNLFISERGTPYTTEGIRKRCRFWISKCGLAITGRAPCHSMRHSYGTLLIRKTDIATVSSNLGHASLSTTSIYAHSVRSLENIEILESNKTVKSLTKSQTQERG